jgi:2-C-methyl-D-erythritol 4-phosphate cytidylyltransferase/2-C-methyl-D-erythritol 2,4-cyclodiphosphate synthase
MDALLGSIGAGDIGEHFPNTEKWRNCNSQTMLNKVVGMLHNKKANIVNVDITIIAEKPKIADYKLLMQKNLANLLGIANSDVNIKATTTEKLGFLGRAEGIACQVVACVNVASQVLEE